MVTVTTLVGVNVPMKLLPPVLRPDGLLEIPILEEDGQTSSSRRGVLLILQTTDDPSSGIWDSTPLQGAWAGTYNDAGLWRVMVPPFLFKTPLVLEGQPPVKPHTKWFFRLQSSIFLPQQLAVLALARAELKYARQQRDDTKVLQRFGWGISTSSSLKQRGASE